MSYLNNVKIKYADSNAIDSFGRLRISEPISLFDSKQLHNAQPLYWTESFGGTGASSWSSANSTSTLSVTNSGDWAIRQTKQKFNYQAGKSQSIFMTGVLNPQTDTTKQLGYFHGSTALPFSTYEGLYFSTDSTTLSVNMAKGGSVTAVAQSSWNIDKFDGTGPSGITLDKSKTQIFIIDFEWLGVGRVRFGFNINGLTHYAHQFLNSNSQTSVYITSPNLPCRYEIRSSGGAGTLDHICCSVNSEAGVHLIGTLFRAVNSAPITLTTSGTTYALLAIKFVDGYSDISVVQNNIDIITTSGDHFKWNLSFNPTIAGTLTFSPVRYSSLQWAEGTIGNTISDLGIALNGGFVGTDKTIASSKSILNNALLMGTTIDGVSDVLVLSVTLLTASNTVMGRLDWREL